MSLADLIVQKVPLPALPSYLTHYQNGITPLSTWPTVIAALATYLAIVFGVQELMRSRQPMKLTALFQLHNIVLSSGSLLLLMLMVEEIVPMIYKNGLFNAMCSVNSWTPVCIFDPYLFIVIYMCRRD